MIHFVITNKKVSHIWGRFRVIEIEEQRHLQSGRDIGFTGSQPISHNGGLAHCIPRPGAKSVEMEKHGSKKIVETKMTLKLFGFQRPETSKKTTGNSVSTSNSLQIPLVLMISSGKASISAH